MTEGGILIYTGFVCILFMGVGILGIYRKVKFSERIRTMHTIIGVLVDYDVAEKRDENNDIVTCYFPIYEYEYGGETRRLESTTSSLMKKGRKVHILVDPQTEKAICLEGEKESNSLLLIFGGIGVIVFILVLLKAAGVI